MDALGYDRFAVAGHDSGYIIAYALAADYSDRVARLIVAEIPRVPVTNQGLPLFMDTATNNRAWHIPFNRVNDDLIIDMVRCQVQGFYRYEYAVQGGGYTPPEYAIQYYIHTYNRSRDTLRATLGLYRAWEGTSLQNQVGTATPITMPVLGIGGELSWGLAAGDAMRAYATDVQSASIPGVGHCVAEQAPQEGRLVHRIPGFLPRGRVAQPHSRIPPVTKAYQPTCWGAFGLVQGGEPNQSGLRHSLDARGRVHVHFVERLVQK